MSLTADDCRAIQESLGPDAVLGVAARWQFGDISGELAFQADTIFPTASCIKVGIVAKLLTDAQDGAVDLSRCFVVRSGDMIGGSGILLTLDGPVELALSDLATLTLTVSDNTASNLCLDAAGGPQTATAFLRERFGMAQTTIHRPISFLLGPGDPPYTATGTPSDFLGLVVAIDDAAKGGDEKDGEWWAVELRRRMLDCADSSMIPRSLPITPRTPNRPFGVPPILVAHKTGGVTGVRADVGWIEAGDDRLWLAIFTKGVADFRWTVDNDACLAIGRIASRLWALRLLDQK